MTQNNLANALMDQAKRSEGPEAVKLLGEAAAAYAAALEVLTCEHFQHYHAGVSLNLASAEQAVRKLTP